MHVVCDFVNVARYSFSFPMSHPSRTLLMASPILCDVEAPLEPEVLLLVVVDEGGDGVVVAAGKEAGGCIFLVDYIFETNLG
jgi:hypothetical protein